MIKYGNNSQMLILNLLMKSMHQKLEKIELLMKQ
uniref:Uncharacterized protein n=1 Tax=CrAss-like virus sp. ctYsL76 TaxID=2826826 RepID=A0A8S5QL21_9CAUD|nr:MAG TPA: hypothetical protein [CrAss-like virus sp. ctYsL76]